MVDQRGNVRLRPVSRHSAGSLTAWGLLIILLGAAAFFITIAATTGDLDIVSGLAPFRCLAGFVFGVGIYRARACFDRFNDVALSALQIASITIIAALLALPANDALIILPFAILVGLTSSDRGLIARVLSMRPFASLGDISYSIYLNHVCVIQILSFFWARTAAKSNLLSADLARIAWLLLAGAAVFIVSVLTYRYVEKPARHYLMRGRRPKEAVGTESAKQPTDLVLDLHPYCTSVSRETSRERA